jgi:predicted 3-demethylubiquinone-9 3-methyltransferase (glyoxalase superfamily)
MVNISHCLWFDKEAEDAAKFYTSIFKGGKILNVSRYGKEGHEIHGQPEGKVMVAEFEILGQKYLALNGGPLFKHSEAFSIVVTCDTQEEIDYYWEKLKADGGHEVECGWLKDKFGVSWQVTPRALSEMLTGPREQAERVTAAFMKMKKFDIAELKRAFAG